MTQLVVDAKIFSKWCWPCDGRSQLQSFGLDRPVPCSAGGLLPATTSRCSAEHFNVFWWDSPKYESLKKHPILPFLNIAFLYIFMGMDAVPKNYDCLFLGVPHDWFSPKKRPKKCENDLQSANCIKWHDCWLMIIRDYTTQYIYIIIYICNIIYICIYIYRGWWWSKNIPFLTNPD